MLESILPVVFAGLMGLAMLMYVILDGYDLGVGMLMVLAKDEEKDFAIGSIGPFWDANETWLVLGVGLLLVAFPHACGVVLTSLYLPVLFMLSGLILRGAAFDFRAKARAGWKGTWNFIFSGGSTLAAFCQGYMLGSYVLGFSPGFGSVAFSFLVGLCVVAAYCLVGSSWLILKSDGPLRDKAICWAKGALIGTALGIGLISLATPMVSERVFNSWFSFPNIFFLAPLPLATAALVGVFYVLLTAFPCLLKERFSHLPFLLTVLTFVLCFCGLAYSFYPYVVPDKVTIWDAASSTESLIVDLVGALLVLPCLIGYTFFCYYVFRGKARSLAYD